MREGRAAVSAAARGARAGEGGSEHGGGGSCVHLVELCEVGQGLPGGEEAEGLGRGLVCLPRHRRHVV